MTSIPDWLGSAPPTRLLIDTNLLVLLAVGRVNRRRIGTFKRTRQYSSEDYDLLIRFVARCKDLYTVAHSLAEVSNLTDLPGTERQSVLAVLRKSIERLHEPVLPSIIAAEETMFLEFGLTHAAIAAVAKS